MSALSSQEKKNLCFPLGVYVTKLGSKLIYIIYYLMVKTKCPAPVYILLFKLSFSEIKCNQPKRSLVQIWGHSGAVQNVDCILYSLMYLGRLSTIKRTEFLGHTL